MNFILPGLCILQHIVAKMSIIQPKYRRFFLDEKAINLVKSVKSVDSGFLARTISMVFG